jgi:hypothetical protein
MGKRVYPEWVDGSTQNGLTLSNTEITTENTAETTNNNFVSGDTTSHFSKPLLSMQKAVSHVWDIQPGGYAGSIITQLTNTNAKGQRKEWAISPPMTAIEVIAFGLWYGEEYPEVSIPKKPETLYEKTLEFRSHRGYPDYINLYAPEEVARLLHHQPAETDNPSQETEATRVNGQVISPEKQAEMNAIMTNLLEGTNANG